ncbi:hypothetical protein CDAR_419401 [Caerostris darwini]|uniref:Uncharacterized protein n=1 Tax=Caerostris darwini TaxID=1538125 RepID=A0AAV4U316_9ARAC|nr:hypothetical protein CDAR_419401 [Caerostris darwini]
MASSVAMSDREFLCTLGCFMLFKFAVNESSYPLRQDVIWQATGESQEHFSSTHHELLMIGGDNELRRSLHNQQSPFPLLPLVSCQHFHFRKLPEVQQSHRTVPPLPEHTAILGPSQEWLYVLRIHHPIA